MMSMYSLPRNAKASAPKNKTEQKKFEREIKKTGTINTDYKLAGNDQVSGFSAVTEEEITPRKKAKPSVNRSRTTATQRSVGRARK